MNVDDLILVSVDDHVIEPPTMFDQHIPDKYRDRAPRVLTDDDGTEYWQFGDERAPYMGLNVVAGCPPEEYGLNPTRYDQMRVGCWDIDERVRDMSANGVLGSLNFPTFPHFCGQLFARCPDKDLAIAVVRAYNDWHIDEWCGSYPGRFIPCAITPFWDPQLMADEVHRIAAKGVHVVTFSENPEKLGHPSLHSDHWDPFWAACQDTGTVACLHIGSSSSLLLTATDAPADVMISITPMNSFLALNDLMWTPIFKKFPEMKVAMSEGGIGWIPYALERMDYVFEHHHAWTGAEFDGLRPSDVYRRNIITCFIDDASGLEQRHRIGVDAITWECDYPHSDSTWPNSPELLSKALADIPDDEIDKMTHLNAMRAFQFDPFAVRPRERCTVGALRAEAADVDTSIRSLGRKNEGGMMASQLASIARPAALDDERGRVKAAVYHGPRDVRIEEVPEPEVGPGDVLIEVSRNGICGSDLHTYVGSGAASLHLPGIVLGHEFAGTVRAVGRDVDDLSVGATVAVAPIEWCGTCAPCRAGKPNLCRKGGIYGGFRLPLHGGLAPFVAVSRRVAFPAPDTLGVIDAALTEPVAVAVHAVRRAPRTLGATVVVLGAGPIGLGVLQSVIAAGAIRTIVSEPSSARRALASAFGATVVVDPRVDDLRSAVRDLVPAGADLVFDTAGVPDALQQGISVLRAQGTLVNVAQWSTPPTVDFGRAMAKEIDLRFAFTYEPEIDFPTAVGLLASGAVDAPVMITDHIPLGALVEDGLEALLHHADEHVKILVDPHR